MKLIIASFLFVSLNGFAQEQKTTTKTKTEGSVETIVKGAKKERKKKVEMCHECGKPEEKCDCKGDEHRKSE